LSSPDGPRRSLALLIAALLLAAPPATAATRGRVVLLRSPAAEALARQSETLLGAELRAARFEVAERDRNASLSVRADMEVAAAALRPLAVLAIVPATADSAAEIWLLDRQTGDLVVRPVVAPPSGSPAEDIALRAVELLRGTLLEIPVEAAPAPPAISTPPPEVVVIAPPPGQDAYFLQGVAVGAAGTALGAPSTAAYAPALRVSYGWPGGRRALRLSAIGLGPGTEARAHDGDMVLGTAQVRRSLLLLEGLSAFRPGARLQPFLAIGVGVHQTGVEGATSSPLFRSGKGTARGLALAAGGGLAARLGRHFALVTEAQMVVVAPTISVRIVDQEAVRVGRPALLLSLGLLVAP
jgi:hypothetical protein